MLTTPIVARFQSSAASSSATDTLKLVRSRSFKERTTWRRSLSDCAASMWSSRVRKAMGMRLSVPSFQFPEKTRPHLLRTENRELRTCLHHCFGGNPLGSKGLDHVAGFDVAIIRDRDAALHAVADFFGVVLEASQRSNLALEHDHIVAQQADFGFALDLPIGHAAT